MGRFAPVIRIDHAQDPRLDPYRDLKARARDPQGTHVVVESAVAVERLLESGLTVDSVLATPSRAERLQVPAGVPLYVVEPALLDAVAGVAVHRGCLASAPRPDPAPLPELTPDANVVVAVGLADPANLGAVARNARAFGVDLLVVGPEGADPWSPRAVRASMGNVFRLPVRRVDDVAQALATLRPGRRVLAAMVGEGAQPLSSAPRGDPFVLLVGNEGAGLSAEVIALADAQLTIPMAPGADSLNVAAATAVLLYALTQEAP
jgi:tRNA G18 (ribose-2'-O)-methylase SpoU